MDAIDAILTRTSIRSFELRPVPPEEITLLLQAAMQAPSAANAQPWHFLVIDDRNLLEEVPKFHPHAESLHTAQAAILVCGDESLQKKPDRWIMDCSAATENILLAVHARGLGAVWLGIHPDQIRIDAIRTLLKLPPEVPPLALVALGYPAKTHRVTRRYNPERVHWNKW